MRKLIEDSSKKKIMIKLDEEKIRIKGNDITEKSEKMKEMRKWRKKSKKDKILRK